MGLHLQWLIPVILIIIWVVNSFLRGNEEERNKNRQRPTPRGDRPPSEPTARRSTSDIDRFLEEVNRRRRQAAERRPTPEPPRQRPPSRPPSAPPPRRQPTSRPVERIPTAEVIPVVEAVATAVAARPPALTAQPAATAQPTPGAVNASVPVVPAPMQQLMGLLASPENLRTAILLREVLGPPRCRRYGA
jgi:hypothetical protein